MSDYYHGVTVAQLRALIASLRDDDELVPNEVKNFAILRDGVYIGWTHLGGAEPTLEFLTDDEDDA